MLWNDTITSTIVKGAILCFRNPYFYFRHEESTSTTSQLTSPSSQKSKDLNKESLPIHTPGYYELKIQSIPPTTFISLQICLKIELSSSTVHSSLCQERWSIISWNFSLTTVWQDETETNEVVIATNEGKFSNQQQTWFQLSQLPLGEETLKQWIIRLGKLIGFVSLTSWYTTSTTQHSTTLLSNFSLAFLKDTISYSMHDTVTL